MVVPQVKCPTHSSARHLFFSLVGNPTQPGLVRVAFYEFAPEWNPGPLTILYGCSYNSCHWNSRGRGWPFLSRQTCLISLRHSSRCSARISLTHTPFAGRGLFHSLPRIRPHPADFYCQFWVRSHGAGRPLYGEWEREAGQGGTENG